MAPAAILRAPAAPASARVGPRARAAPGSAAPDALAASLASVSISSATTRPTRPTRPTHPTGKPNTPAPAPTSRARAPVEPPTAAEVAKDAMRTVNGALQTLSAIAKAGWRALPVPVPVPGPATPASRPASSASLAKDHDSHSHSRVKADEAGAACRAALAQLRVLARAQQINNRVTDIEKGAGSLVASLVELGLYDHALRELAAIRASILSWWLDPAAMPPIPGLGAALKPTTASSKVARPSPSPSPLAFAPILAVPLPPKPFFDPPTLVEALSPSCRPKAEDVIPLVLLVQQFTLGCIFRAPLSPADLARRPHAVAQVLVDAPAGSPVQWRGVLEQLVEDGAVDRAAAEIVVKKADAMMSSMFGTLTKGCIDADALAKPETLLAVRAHSLFIFATTRTLLASQDKLDMFYDQTRKVLLLFGRQAEKLGTGEKAINAGVKGVFEQVLAVLVARDAPRVGKAWVALCEVVIHIAKRAADLQTVERVSLLLEATTSPKADPELQVAQLCAKLATAHSVLALFYQSGEDKGVVEQVRRCVLVVPLLSRLRAQPLTPDAYAKIDKALDRIQYATARHLKGGKRSDQLCTPAGETRPPPTLVESELAALLDALAGHAEAVHRTFSATTPPPPAMLVGQSALYADAIDSLVLLAYSRLTIEDRQTYTPSFASLERCLTLLYASTRQNAIATISLAAPLSLRSVASAYYNIGGALFNAAKPEAAIRFARRACEISQAAVGEWDGQDRATKDAKEATATAVEALRTHLPKRYELLALANQAIGDKGLAFEAYVSAITVQPPASLASLEQALHTLPISTLLSREAGLFRLVQRATKLAAFDLLLPGPRVCLRDRLRERPAAAAAVVELQVAALESSLDKPEAAGSIAVMLEQLLQLYPPAVHPMRRARTLVRRMQHQCSPATITFDLAAAAAAAEIESLCTQDSPGDDAGLTSFAPQYLAMSHLWLAFHAHQARQDGAGDATHTEARQALRILREALDANIPPSPSAPKRSPVKTKVPNPKEKATVRRRPVAPPTTAKSAFKTPQVSRTLAGRPRTVTVDLVTPPSRNLLEHGDKGSPRKGDIESLVLDDAEKCYATIESMANLLGALGYTLLRISYLKFLRRLAARTGAKDAEGFVTMSAHLGDEYTRLGKTSRAGLIFAQAEARIQQSAKVGTVFPEAAHITYLTLYAGYLAVLGNHDRSTTAYSEARTLADAYRIDEKGLSTTLRIVERTLRLQRTASASTVCSTMLQRKGDLTRSLQPAMQAYRLWHRALSNVSRLAVAPSTSQTPSPDLPSDEAFVTSTSVDSKAPLPDFPTAQPKRQHPARVQWPNTGLAWLLADGLARAILRVATLHSIRGTPKAAEYYADQALSFAQDLGSIRLGARALVVRTEVRLHAGKYVEAEEDLSKISAMLGPTFSGPEVIEARRLRADLHMRMCIADEAHQEYLEAQKELDAYVLAAAEGEPVPPPASQVSPLRLKMLSPSLATSTSERHDHILPAIQAYLLRVRVGLLRSEDRQDESQALLARLSKLGITEEDKADEFKLLASIQFNDLLIRFASDPVLGMLPESVLSIPTLSVPAAATTKAVSPRSGPSLHNGLREIETLLSRAMNFSVSRSQPAKLRDLSLLTATHRALNSSAGRPSKRSAATVASTLDLGLAVTLRREMLDAIDVKLAECSGASHDDLDWPPLEPATVSSKDEDCTSSAQATTQYWTSIRERYRIESAEASMTDAAFSTLLPTAWTVISLHLTTERDALLLVRHRRGTEPLVFKLPLDRVSRREEGDAGLTFDLALGELQDIIADSNAGTHRAKDVVGKDERAAWWRERKTLNERLERLTNGLEDSWLSAFKSVFMDGRHLDTDAVATFRSRVERILKRSIIRSHEKKVSRFKLDDDILACLAALPPTVEDQDIEDLFYFIMESFQFTGVPVALDEIDVDQVAVDLRTALEELHATKSSTPPTEGDHTFLLLDKALQAFPWESIPCLRGRSVSRLPSLAFLRDRIDLARMRSPDDESYNIVVDSSRTSFLLNPSGDLKNTQATFESWLEAKKGQGWSGIVGRAPSDLEMKAALSTNELFLYFGHGGAEQYVRSQTIRHLRRCAVTMLWGCSSGLLKDLGDYDPVGTPYHYMIAGCPALVANLWDVTDKDIDKMAEAVFRKTGLGPDGAGDAEPRQTLAEAVGSSRDVCTLPYLNGAAAVLYGIPVSFK